jgi:hypothetical protein
MGKARDNGGVAIGHSRMGHARMADANAPDSSQPVFKSLHLRPGEIGHLAWAFEGNTSAHRLPHPWGTTREA